MRPICSYLAILGDLVGSRDADDRAALQHRLKHSLLEARTTAPLAQVLAAGPEITAGDEIQALLHVETSNLPGHAALSFLAHVTEDIRPCEIAFGLGFGKVSTELGGPVRELDGSSFHEARRALQIAKQKGRWAVVRGLASEERGALERSAVVMSALQRAANSILRLTGDIRSGWSDRQLEVIRVRRKLPLQKDVAKHLKVSPSVVSEVLRAARHDAVLEAEETVVEILNIAASPESFRFPGTWPR